MCRTVNQSLLGLRVLLAAHWEEGSVQALQQPFGRVLSSRPGAARTVGHPQRSRLLPPLSPLPGCVRGARDPVSGASGKGEALGSELLLWSLSPYRVEHR